MLPALMEKETITSLELLDQINFFRWKEGNNAATHRDLLAIIETEFTDFNRKTMKGIELHSSYPQIKKQLEASGIIVSEYIHPQNKQKYPMYILTLNQARQVLSRESRLVRKALFEYIDKLENQNKQYREAIQEIQNNALKLQLNQANSFILGIVEKLGMTAPQLELEENEPVKEKKLKTIATKRGLIHKILLFEPGFDTVASYNKLYEVFEKKHQINLFKGMAELERTNKIKYIERDLKMIDELVEIAKELCPTGYKKVKKAYNTDFSYLKK